MQYARQRTERNVQHASLRVKAPAGGTLSKDLRHLHMQNRAKAPVQRTQRLFVCSSMHRMAADSQGAVAHSPAHGGAHHRHLAARAAAAQQIGAQEKKRYVLRRRADGSQCRVKGAAFAPSSSAAAPASAASPAAASSASPAPSPSASAAQGGSNDYSTEQSQDQAPAESSPSPSLSPAEASPSPAPSPSPSAASNPVSAVINTAVSNSHGKLGNAWPNGNWDDQGSAGWIGNYVGSKASWYYTWSPHNVGNADSIGQEFVPMLWGPHQVGDWESLQASWPSAVKNALFFNVSFFITLHGAD